MKDEQLANEEVDRLRSENKDLRAEIYTLNVRIEGQNSSVLRFNKETNEMSRRAIQAEDELAKVKDDFDKAIEQRDKALSMLTDLYGGHHMSCDAAMKEYGK